MTIKICNKAQMFNQNKILLCSAGTGLRPYTLQHTKPKQKGLKQCGTPIHCLKWTLRPHQKRNSRVTLKPAQSPTWHFPSGWASRVFFIKIQKPYPCFLISLYYPFSRWKTTCKGLGSLLIKYATRIYTIRFSITKRFPNILMGRFVLGFSSGVSL